NYNRSPWTPWGRPDMSTVSTRGSMGSDCNSTGNPPPGGRCGRPIRGRSAGVVRAVLTRQDPLSPTGSRPGGADEPKREHLGPCTPGVDGRQRLALATRDADDQSVARSPARAFPWPRDEVEVAAPIRTPMHEDVVHALLVAVVARDARARR